MKKIEQFQETEDKLIHAYEKLLVQQSKISVDMICEEANLHHQTFYRHFKNKEDFFVYCITKKINNFIEENNHLELKDVCIQLLEHCYPQANLYRAYLKCPKSRQIISTKLTHYFADKTRSDYGITDRKQIFFIIGGILFYIIQCITHSEAIDIKGAELSLEDIFDKIQISFKPKQ